MSIIIFFQTTSSYFQWLDYFPRSSRIAVNSIFDKYQEWNIKSYLVDNLCVVLTFKLFKFVRSLYCTVLMLLPKTNWKLNSIFGSKKKGRLLLINVLFLIKTALLISSKDFLVLNNMYCNIIWTLIFNLLYAVHSYQTFYIIQNLRSLQNLKSLLLP